MLFLTNAIADEKTLLSRVTEGDSDAFKILYDHYWNDLYALALAFLKSPDWADDIVQDLFLKLWIKRAALGAIGEFRSYVFITLRNELISALRRKKRILQLHERYRQQIPADFLLPHQPDRPDNRAAYKELQQLLQQAIAQLPPSQRLLIELTRQQGLSHEVVAERLGMAKKTVSNTLT